MNNRENSTVNPVAVSLLDFGAIKEFNPGLVYGFDPEGTERDLSQLDDGFHIVGQYQDVYDAYRYAQDTILDEIKKTGIQNITSQQILFWLNQIHKRMAATLAKDIGTVSGEYTTQQVVRWPDIRARDAIVSYLLGNISETELWKFCESINVDINAAKPFVKLLKDIDKRNIKIPQDLMNSIDKNAPTAPAIVILNKLITLYHENALTDEEKIIVDNFLKICMPPHRLKSAMHEYAENLAAKLHQCNPSDPNKIDDVVHVVFDAFYSLTEIHPYFNGNGRTATCWGNIILRGLGYPSILFRYPQERFDPKSSYSKAIKCINSNPALMREHLKQRIESVRNGNDFKDDELRELVNTRIKMMSLLCDIKEKYQYASAELAKLFDFMSAQALQETFMSGKFNNVDMDNIETSYTNAFSLQMNKLIVSKCGSLLGKFAVKKSGLQNLSISKPKYDAVKKTQIVNHLKQLIGEDGDWKPYVKEDSLIIHINLDTPEEANHIRKVVGGIITDEGVVKIGGGMNKKFMKHTVSLEILDPDKLLKINPISNQLQMKRSD